MNRHEKGQEIATQLFGAPVQASGPEFEEIVELTSDYLFGEVWSRPGLPIRDRSLITVAVLCANGQEPQLRSHLQGALNVGHSPDALKEVMIHVAHYAGWPTGMNGLRVLGEVVESRGLTFQNESVE
ncbi:MAG: carboxymuconolactone decarboxylase family protein [Pseudomonadota bacterium]